MMTQPIENIVNEFYEQGLSIIPLGSPFELPPQYFVERCKDLEEAKEKWPKTPRIAWKQYQITPPTEQEIESWLKRWPNTNWAILTGQALIVVDGDSLESCQFIESNLTKTPWVVITAKGKHYYFKVPRSFIVKNSVDQNIKIDIRGVGGYVVAPGSTHVTGHVYELVNDVLYDATTVDDLPEFTQADLIAINNYNGQFVKRESTGNLSAIGFAPKQLPHDGSPVGEGGRNSAATSMAGQYIQQGYSLQETKALLDSWNGNNNPPLSPDELNTTIASVASTHARNTGDQVLIERPAIDKSKIATEVQEDEQGDFILKPPGVLGEFVDHYMASAPKPNMVLAIQAALALGSVLAGRIYQTTSANTSNLYFISVANSGVGKEHARTLINNVLAESNNADLMGDDAYTSGQAVISKLLDSPAHITIIDEFGRHMEAQKKADTSLAVEANSKLMEAFGAATGVLRAKTNSTLHLTQAQKATLQNKVVFNPSLSLLGLTTPKRFYDALSNELVQDGFLGRFLVATTTAERQPFKHKEALDLSLNILDWAKRMRQPPEWTMGGGNLTGFSATDATVKPDIIKIRFSDEAIQSFEQFDIKILKKQKDLEKDGLEELLARGNEIAMRLAMIIALSENASNRTISAAHAAWAQQYTEANQERLLQAVRAHVSDSEFGQLVQACINKILSFGKRGCTLRDLKRALSKVRGLRPRELNELKQALNDHEDLQAEQVTNGGRPALRWFFIAE
jgi:hypothetical protein